MDLPLIAAQIERVLVIADTSGGHPVLFLTGAAARSIEAEFGNDFASSTDLQTGKVLQCRGGGVNELS